jgi:hypothetical protein
MLCDEHCIVDNGPPGVLDVLIGMGLSTQSSSATLPHRRVSARMEDGENNHPVFLDHIEDLGGETVWSVRA